MKTSEKEAVFKETVIALVLMKNAVLTGEHYNERVAVWRTLMHLISELKLQSEYADYYYKYIDCEYHKQGAGMGGMENEQA